MPKLTPPETSVYIVWEPERAGPAVIEAYSPGQAVEYFLATHGLFGYSDIHLVKLPANEVHLISQVGRIVNIKECENLDSHHHWKEITLA